MEQYFSRFILKQITQTLPPPIHVSKYLTNPRYISQVQSLLLDSQNYKVMILPSSIATAGLGVYIKGIVNEDTVVTLYPGTIYNSWDPKLLVSIGNCYLLRCFDGIIVDGRPRGLSGFIYRGLQARLRTGIDWTRMPIGESLRPAYVGNYVNHHSEANVRYQELDVPLAMDILPKLCNLPFNGSMKTSVRMVGLVTTRRIENEELFTTYNQSVI